MNQRNWNRRTDQQLLVAARDDPSAFGVVYRRHSTAVHGFFRRRGLGVEQALDLTAETFAVALDAVESYVPGSEPGLAWIYGIARNLMLQSFREGRVQDAGRRRLGLEPLAYTDAELEALESKSEADDISQRLRSEIERLPVAQREAMLARIVDEADYRQIAAQLACSEQLVRKQVSRGLSRLRHQLQETR